MCLAVPGKVISIEESIENSPKMAQVDFAGVVQNICIDWLPEVQVGEYVIVHVGFAISKMDEQEAFETLEMFRQMDEGLEDLDGPDCLERGAWLRCSGERRAHENRRERHEAHVEHDRAAHHVDRLARAVGGLRGMFGARHLGEGVAPIPVRGAHREVILRLHLPVGPAEEAVLHGLRVE